MVNLCKHGNEISSQVTTGLSLDEPYIYIYIYIYIEGFALVYVKDNKPFKTSQT